ncbi:BatD family protein [Niabella drilacis]|uniref:Oxygen tolerance n=1 Tax=Niabella drilacis (strain DSM 25811 / CCM 8410 / CCUG 62505 / LMG 26954 / E90) TaxID=1285928 RepID=A0A1G7BUC6_NIADE|nr:BatD family protein [Niabella drilacis]SDE29966.1 Oxygen tolerance [Niabella drilacis]
MKRFGLLTLLLLASVIMMAQRNVLEARLRSSIYLNVYANKTNCYVGEPIIVTYKLYSSLESVSEVVKDPAFTGFEFRDLISPGDGMVSRETVNGESFDVHTIRKVQLTPLEAGKLELDPMVISNRIKLSDGTGNRSAILDGIDENIPLKNGEYRMTISSVPIAINVNNAPANAPTPVYNGAVGDFKMNIHLSKINFTPGERGTLQISITGAGDFSQVTQPAVEWPKEIVVYPANVQEQYDRNNRTGPGSKTFTIPFTTGKVGSYTIMPIRFSYFDAKQNRYNTINNPPVTFYSREPGAARRGSGPVNTAAERNDNFGALLVGLGIVALLLLVLLLVRRSRKKGPVAKAGRQEKHSPAAGATPVTVAGPAVPQPEVSVELLLQPAENAVSKAGSSFYSQLKQGMLQFFEQRYQVSAALFNKAALKENMTFRNVPEPLQNEVFNTLTEIEMNIYSAGGMDHDRVKMLEKTKAVLHKL